MEPTSSETPSFDPRHHRKLVRHFDEPGHAHELTFSCYQRLPLLNAGEYCALLSQAIERAVENQGFELVAFVYMPEHVHLIVRPIRDEGKVSKLLWAIKRPHSYRVTQSMLAQNDSMLDRLTIRERPGTTVFRFWQEGGGYDRNVHSEKVLKVAIDYVHHNPVRRGLCGSPGDWLWSSWRFYWEPESYADPRLPQVHGWSG